MAINTCVSVLRDKKIGILKYVVKTNVDNVSIEGTRKTFRRLSAKCVDEKTQHDIGILVAVIHKKIPSLFDETVPCLITINTRKRTFQYRFLHEKRSLCATGYGVIWPTGYPLITSPRKFSGLLSDLVQRIPSEITYIIDPKRHIIQATDRFPQTANNERR